jgi:hypothetical protein
MNSAELVLFIAFLDVGLELLEFRGPITGVVVLLRLLPKRPPDGVAAEV